MFYCPPSLIRLAICFTIVAIVSARQNEAAQPANPATAAAATAAATDRFQPQPPAAESSSEQAQPSGTLCARVAPAAIGQITGATYADTSSQADLPAMKHCEYRGGQNVVSITVIVGANAASRFQTSKQFPGIESVSNLGDAAVWEPVRGALSVLAGDRAVDVTVNRPHGSASVRQQFARQIVQLVLARL